MAITVLTKEDLTEFGNALLSDIKEILAAKPCEQKPWLKSSEVRKLLNISPGTLQTLRINKTLSYTRVGGILYYAQTDINKLLETNKVSSESNLFNSK